MVPALLRCPVVISIHAPRAGSDALLQKDQNEDDISIHAPRAGSDRSMPSSISARDNFNPRSPCGERQ